MIKLNLGCNEFLIEGYTNIDLYHPKADVKADVRNLPYKDEEVDEILASHLIEHFDFKEAYAVLREWNRTLKKDGLITIETPDLLGLCYRFINSDEMNRVNLYGTFFAKPWIEGETHKFLYTENQLRWTLSQCGFKNIQRVPALRWIGLEDISLKMIANKE